MYYNFKIFIKIIYTSGLSDWCTVNPARILSQAHLCSYSHMDFITICLGTDGIKASPLTKTETLPGSILL